MAYFQVTIKDALCEVEKGYIVKAESFKEVSEIMSSYLPNCEGDFKVRVVKSFKVELKVTCVDA